MRSSSRFGNRILTVVLWSLALLFAVCACGPSAGSGNTVPVSSPPYRPFLALHVCLDNTGSYPVQFQQEALHNIANSIDSSISPNMGGLLVDVNLIEVNSLQDTLVSFSVPAIPAMPSKPHAGNDPYKFATAMRDWKEAVAHINRMVASEKAAIQPFLDTMRSFHKQEAGGTDIPGCADTASGEFAHVTQGNKILLYVSDMQNNIDVQFDKHIDLYGATVRVIFRPCQVQSACDHNDAFWTQQFKTWGASSVAFFAPAESEAEHITF